jgi:tRNA threonylcarbamoyladenosine biosynthesis protein TsaE
VKQLNEYKIRTSSPEDTMKISEKLGMLAEEQDVFILEGDLGAGKTTFTKGLAKGLGVNRVVNSPTFNIIKEYKGRIPLYHMDVYRLAESEEDLGFDEYFYGSGVTVVEWAHLIEHYLPSSLLKISLFHEGGNNRGIVLEPKGERYIRLCEELLKNESISN